MQNTRRSPLLVGSSILSSMFIIVALFAIHTQSVRAAESETKSVGNVFTWKIGSTLTTRPTATRFGADGFQVPEIREGIEEGEGDGSQEAKATAQTGSKWLGINRSESPKGGKGAATEPAHRHGTTTQLKKSFDGLTHRDQRLANNGNQFSVEPPDQGLCVGNGFVMETVNDVLNVYDSNGNSLLGVTDLNSFYGYAPAIVRGPTPAFGPFVTDPSCYYDVSVRRWFHVVLTLDRVGTTAEFAGTNHIDIAVSKTDNPTGDWVIYRLPAQNDGTDGTPNHHCPGGPCLGDYPHLGADAAGFYITTNEYPLFEDGFHGAQIYAFSKLALAANLPVVQVSLIDTAGLVNGNPGFTVWPALSPDRQFSRERGGTEYFLSSNAAEEANGNGTSNQLIVWSLTNTFSLNTFFPRIRLDYTILPVLPYSIPPKATQKPGPFPLGECLNNTECATLLNGEPDPFVPEVEGVLDSNDTRMQQVMYANGLLWGALDTALTIQGKEVAGIEWFVVNPRQSAHGIEAKLVRNGHYGAANANLTYPAIGITASGKGVMAFTLTGPNDYPSAAYAPIDAKSVGPIQIAAPGKGPQDGFSEYKYYANPPGGTPRPRWGDYGAAVPVGNDVWIASEYSGQSCTLQQYLTDTPESPLFTCNKTRTALGNWYTRISRVAVR
jgi:hypothetical protein